MVYHRFHEGTVDELKPPLLLGYDYPQSTKAHRYLRLNDETIPPYDA